MTRAEELKIFQAISGAGTIDWASWGPKPAQRQPPELRGSQPPFTNGDPPYRSAVDAMRFWPETATAVAVRYVDRGDLEIAAPFGLDDLFRAVVRPTPHFLGEKRAVFAERVRRKGWLEQWPSLRVELE